ncbi:MAG: methyl-accepting chemotaxis protein [bacterium]|nr:methyl-accepting chemotaxis protein [bacterium]
MLKLIRNMKIGWKVFSGFGAVLLIMLGVGLFAVQSLRTVAGQTEINDGLLNDYMNRSATLTQAIGWAYPVFREAEALMLYLQSEDYEEQQALYKRFQIHGEEFARINETIKTMGNSTEEIEKIAEIEGMQQEVLDQAVRLIAVRDGEGEFGPETRAALHTFQNRIRAFVAAIEYLVVMEKETMEAIRLESLQVSQNARSRVRDVILMTRGASGLALIIGLLISFGLSRMIVAPIHRAVAMTRRIAAGDLSHDALDSHCTDEIGAMLTSLNTMAGNLRSMFEKIQGAALKLSSASEAMAESSTQIAKGTEVQSKSSGQVASAAHEMRASATRVAEHAAGVAASAKTANQVAHQGGEVVSKTIESMKTIARASRDSSQVIATLGARSQEIEKIIRVIDDIADQTNLLALNAAIEAARAGEQGRGFAVVADEVRKLAERTTQATKEVGGTIAAIQSETARALETMASEEAAVDNGGRLTEAAGEALARIVAQVEEVSDMIEQIASAAGEQSAAAQQISKDIETMAEITQDNWEGAREIVDTCSGVSELGTSLQHTVKMFKLTDRAASAVPSDVLRTG